MVQGSSGRIRRGLSWGIFIFTTVLVVAGGIAARTAVEGRDHARFEGVVQSTCDRIENRLEIYTALLLSTRAMLDARDGAIDAAHFRTYVKELDLRRTYPGIQGIGFTRKLPQDRAGFVREVETSGVPGFRVWPDHPGDEHHAVVLLEPLDQRNQAAIGFDMSSEPVRREAMLKARDTGSAVASGPVTLVQEIDDDKQVGFLIYVPIYRGGGVPSSVEARREALLGFVYSPFRSDDLLRGIFWLRNAPRRLRGARCHRTVDARVPIRSEPERRRAYGELGAQTRRENLVASVLDLARIRTQFEPLPVAWLVVVGGVATCVVFVLLRRQERVAEELRIRGQVLESMREGVSVSNEDGVILYTNQARRAFKGHVGPCWRRVEGERGAHHALSRTTICQPHTRTCASSALPTGGSDSTEGVLAVHRWRSVPRRVRPAPREARGGSVSEACLPTRARLRTARCETVGAGRPHRGE